MDEKISRTSYKVIMDSKEQYTYSALNFLLQEMDIKIIHKNIGPSHQ